jgi:hypothetical protein
MAGGKTGPSQVLSNPSQLAEAKAQIKVGTQSQL